MTTGQTVTQQINQAIADAGGSTRDALNDVLAGRDAAVALLRIENEKTLALLVALEQIRAVIWPPGVGFPLSTADTEAVDKIACDALCVAGEIAMTGMAKED